MCWKFITSVMAVCALTACSTGGGNSSSAGSPANNFGIDRRPVAARSVNTPVTVMNTSVDNTVRVENYVNSILPDDWLQRSASIAAANNGRRDGTNPVDAGRGNNEVLANYRAQMAQNQMTELKKLASDFDTRVTEIEPIQLRYAYMLAGGNDSAIDWDTWDTDSDAIIATVGDWFTNHASDVNNIIKTYGDPRQTLADIDFAVMNNDTPFTYKYKIDTKTNAITDIVFDADVAGINAGTEIERDADTNTFTHDNKSVMIVRSGQRIGVCRCRFCKVE